MEQFILTSTPEQAGIRLDRYLSESLAELASLTRSMIQRLCEDGLVTVADKAVGKSYKIKPGDTIVVLVPPPKELAVLPQEIPLVIVYEDKDLLVVDKPKGLVVHPAAGNEDGTLVNALLFHCREELSGIGGVMRPGIVHRIDKDTSGLLVVAKTDLAHQKLSESVKEHSFTRKYQAIVYGRVKEDAGTIDAPIGRHPTDRKKMAVTDKHARHAISHYRVLSILDCNPAFTHVEVQLETGRTHQIRVHMASIGHPVAGDPVYGPKKVITSLNGQCLHAGLLGFTHPVTGVYLEFESPLPDYFNEFLARRQGTTF